MKSFFIGCFLLIYSTTIFSQASNTWSVKFSDAIVARYQPTIDKMTGKGWEYSNSIILHGMEKVYANVPNATYLNYIKAYVDAFVSSTGAITGLAQSLDKIHPGILCLFLYEKTGQTKYKTAATNLRNYLLTGGYPKTPNGGYWHKNQAAYKNVMMADGMYMAHPFLAKYGRMFNDQACLDTAASQILMLNSKIFVSSTNLVKHAWNYDKTTFPWSDPTTGVSREVWSRGMGWYVMAIVDVLKYLPSTHPKYDALRTLLSNLAIGIKNTQNATTGLWYDVVDKGTSSGNYLETSGSGMFVYALKVASDSGWISSATYLPVAQKGWTGLKTKISTYTDGKPQINGFAPAMSVQNDYASYVAITPVNCPTASGTQHPHGYAAILMAASVMEFPLAPGFSANPAVAPVSDDNTVSWNAFPNPSSGQVTITYQSSKDQSTTLTLHDAAGMLLQSKRVSLKKGSNKIVWDISAEPTGVYFINVNQPGTSPLKVVRE